MALLELFFLLWRTAPNKNQSNINNFFRLAIGYIAWQVPVGFMLALSINEKIPVISSGAFSDRFNDFLMGPTVQLIGLLASLYGFINIFISKEENNS